MLYMAKIDEKVTGMTSLRLHCCFIVILEDIQLFGLKLLLLTRNSPKGLI